MTTPGGAPVLYLAPGASSMAPHIALAEAGADFTVQPVSFRQKQNRSAEFLAINPEGKVPVLVVDGAPLTEVAAILWWIGRTYPDACLLPAAMAEEAQAISWMSFLAATVHPAGRQGQEAGRAAYAMAERKLAGRRWAIGETMTVVDIHLFRLFWRFQPLLDLPRADYPGLWSLHDRMMERPAVQRVIAAESAIGYELPMPRGQTPAA